MKKIIYTAILVVTLAVSFSSCTEEVVKPKNTTGGPTGGGTSSPCTKGC